LKLEDSVNPFAWRSWDAHKEVEIPISTPDDPDNWVRAAGESRSGKVMHPIDEDWDAKSGIPRPLRTSALICDLEDERLRPVAARTTRSENVGHVGKTKGGAASISEAIRGV